MAFPVCCNSPSAIKFGRCGRTRFARLAGRSVAAISRRLTPRFKRSPRKKALFQSGRRETTVSAATANRQHISPARRRSKSAPPRPSGRRDQHRVRIHAEAEIRLACPVFQVVARLEPGAGEVGNLVLSNAGRLQLFAGRDDKSRRWLPRPAQSARDSECLQRSARVPAASLRPPRACRR